MSADWILEVLVRSSLQGALFIGGVWIVCRLFPRLPASLRCGLWWAACLKLLVGLVWISPVELPLLPAAARVAPAAETRAFHIENAAAALSAPATEGASSSPGSGAPPKLPFAILALWLAGLLALSVKAARQLRHTRWVIRRSEPLREDWIRSAFAELCDRLGLRRAPGLRSSEDVRTPQAIGLVRPLVVLPQSGLTRLSPPEVSMTLCHELLHLRRGDLWLGWVPALAHRIFFFHPLAALAAREYAIAREAACDAEVIRVLGSAPQAYGRLLLRWGVAPRETGLAAAGASPSLQNLKRRLQMLQHSSDNKISSHKRRFSGWWWLAGAAVLVGLIPLRMVAQEPAPEAEVAPEAAAAPEPVAAPEAVPAPEPVLAPDAVPAPEAAPTPATLPPPPTAGAPAPPAGSIPGGVRGGIPGGVEGGVRGGVAGAIADGVTGGVAGALPARAPRPASTPVPAPHAVAPGTPVPSPRPVAAVAPVPPVGRAPRAVPPAGTPRPGAAPVPAARLASGIPAPAPTPAAAPVARAQTSGRAAPPPPPAPPAPPVPPVPPKSSGFSYRTGDHDGDSWVLLYGDNSFSASTDDLRQAKRLRSSSKEDILWFRHNGKAYVVRDAATLKQAKEILRPQMELGAKQGELGGRQGELGGRQGALGARQGALGAEMAAVAADRRGSDADDRDLDRRMEELSRKQEELGRQQAELGRQQAALGREQAELGRQQEALSRKVEKDFRALMDRAIQSGVAQAVR
jgi:beta-lactamase regulating signal transducer with metallopeptidase domain